MRRLRPQLPATAVFGSQHLYADPSALIGEIGHPSSISKFWPLASGLIFLFSDHFLMTSETEEERWQQKMDEVLQEDAEGGITRIRWKASRHGGRPFAAPSATSTQLAAARRPRGSGENKSQALQSIAEVEVVGNTKADEHEVIKQLMSNLGQLAGLPLQESEQTQEVKTGTWKWLGSISPTTSAGRSRIFRKDSKELRKVRNALHGRTIKIGVDSYMIRVYNDAVDVKSRGRSSE